MSAEAGKLLSSMNRYAASPKLWVDNINRALGAISEQNKAVRELTASMDAQLAQYDPLTEKVNQLRAAHQYANDEELRALAQRSVALDQQRQQVRDAAREARETRRAEGEAMRQAAGGTGAAAGTRALPGLGRIEIVLPDGTQGDLVTNAEGADLVQQMIGQLTRDRSVSQLRRRP
ncbi:hypothetical protein [Luteimonas cellulosilyticus]|nr:hypothetical protein [Luteimonas cellulosilyticus]